MAQMTMDEAMVSIAQTLLRRRHNADALVRAGTWPSALNISVCVVQAAGLLHANVLAKAICFGELCRRYDVPMQEMNRISFE